MKAIYAVVLSLLVLNASGAVNASRDDCWAGVEETAGMEWDDEAPSSPPPNGDCLYWTNPGYEYGDHSQAGCLFQRGDQDYKAEYRVSGLSCSGPCEDQCGSDWMGNGSVQMIEVVTSFTSNDMADGNGTFFARAMGVCMCENIGYPVSTGGRLLYQQREPEPEILYLERRGFPRTGRGDGESRPIFKGDDIITVTGRVQHPGQYVLASGDWVSLDRLLQRAVLLPEADYIDVSRNDDTADGHMVLNWRGMSRELLTVASLVPQRVPRVFPGDRVIVR